MEGTDRSPDFLRGLRILKEGKILGGNRSFFHEPVKVDHAFPEFLSDQNHRQGIDLPGLQKRQCFKEFVHGSKTPRKSHQRFCSGQKVHLSEGKVMKLKTQLRGDVGVGLLFMGEGDVQTDALGAVFECTPVGRLHYPRTTPGDHHQFQPIALLTAARHQTGQFSSLVVVVTLCQHAASDLDLPL